MSKAVESHYSSRSVKLSCILCPRSCQHITGFSSSRVHYPLSIDDVSANPSRPDGIWHITVRATYREGPIGLSRIACTLFSTPTDVQGRMWIRAPLCEYHPVLSGDRGECLYSISSGSKCLAGNQSDFNHAISAAEHAVLHFIISSDPERTIYCVIIADLLLN
ncbi:hypothetical protein PCH_Pc17g00900 [Penicillium rubens Wisconsin 54-1255]|uniref:Uncharacterized protein n=1 Tax=Penicillium rubens (strain ATCC 28089 / DSM 1075 / NRRL 1951 / Wisconsin 54-1255) TaxID=500485 RepID=B6HB10_PENRW|nr:hypothetical protein PCH_Pc17g00900 [Penicillium rubens Wisconsin 54-1255]